MKTIIVSFGLALAVVNARPAIQPPQVGFAVDLAGTLHPLLGFAGNLISGEALGEGVTSAASSGTFTLVKTDSSIQVLDVSGEVIYGLDATSGPALFSFDTGGSPALVYSGGSLMIWRTDCLEPLQFNGDGVIVALGAAAVVVQRDDGLWRLDISTVDGSVQGQTALPALQCPLVILNDGQLVSADSIDVGEPVTGLVQLGKGWVIVNHKFAVRVTPGREYVSQLPEAQ